MLTPIEYLQDKVDSLVFDIRFNIEKSANLFRENVKIADKIKEYEKAIQTLKGIKNEQ